MMLNIFSCNYFAVNVFSWTKEFFKPLAIFIKLVSYC